jgi:radical S-adenosyl methionine domain-containing protein 2
MASSYLILDEYLRFLGQGGGQEGKSEVILEVGVAKALKQINWDEESFHARGGIYDWSAKDASKADGCGGGLQGSEDLEW